MQEWCRAAFHDVNNKSFVVVNDFFAILTLVSVLVVVLETMQSLSGYHGFFVVIEYISVFFFSLEYIGRVIAADRPIKYIFSFFGIIDILAILPTYLGVANFTFLKSVRLLRVLRFLRILRLAKLMRLPKKNDMEDHGHDALFGVTIQIYAVTLFTVVLLSATMMWFFEGSREVFANIPQAMIWSMKVVLGGIGQEAPETLGGQFVVIATRFSGLILFSLLISITGGFVRKILLGAEDK